MIKSAAIIIPPLCDFYFTRHRFSVLGAEIVKTVLEDAGIAATMFNFPLMQPKGTVIALPPELSHLKPCLIPGERGALSFFTHYRRFGTPDDRCAELIEAVKPDICLFSLFAFCYGDDALTLAAQIKRRNPALPLVIGGAGASVYPGYFLKGAFDFVLQGEAEAVLPPFLDQLRKGRTDFETLPGVHARADARQRDRDHFPRALPPAMRIPLIKTIESSHTVTYAVSLARGCPKRCDFCSSTLLSGKTLRTVPIDRLDETLRGMARAEQTGKRIVINIEDDNLLCDEGYFKAAVARIRSYFPEVEFIAENGLDYALLSPELCTWLIDNGMRKFNLSLAATDPAILRTRQRSLDLDRYESVLSQLSARNIPSVTYIICGFEGETRQTVAAALNYLSDKPTMIGLSPFYPVPGLRGFTATEQFDSLGARRCCGSALYPWNRSLSTGTMVTAFRLARLSNLKKSLRRSAMETKVLSLIEQEKKLFTITKEPPAGERIVPVPDMDEELVRRVMFS